MAFTNNACNITLAGITTFDGSALFYGRTLTAGSSKVSITNGNGTGGNPTIDVVPANISINALGSTPLSVANGGTNLTSTPTNGQLLIGNGTGYSLSTLTAGSNVTITNGAGTITISASGSVSGVSSITGTANQVLANGTSGSPTVGAITLTLPQSIGTASNVTFGQITANNGVVISGAISGGIFYANGSAQVVQDSSNLFWDATNHRLGLGTTSPAFTLQIGGGIGYKYVSKAINYTLAITDTIIGANSSGGAITLNLPAVVPSAGWTCEIKDIGGAAATNNITISGNGNNIDGASSIALTTNYSSVSIISNGTNYYIVSGYNRSAQNNEIVFVRTAINADYEILATDELIAVTGGIAPPFFSIALPFTTIIPAGKVYIIKDESGQAGVTQPIQVTVQIPNPTNATIQGSTTTNISTAYGVIRLYTDGQNWFFW